MPAEPTNEFLLGIVTQWNSSSSSTILIRKSHDGQFLATVGMALLQHGLINSYSIHRANTQSTIATGQQAMWNMLTLALRSHLYGVSEEPLTPDEADILRVESAVAELRQAVNDATPNRR